MSENTDESSVPVTWPQLIAVTKPTLERQIQYVEESVKKLDESSAKRATGNQIAGLSELLSLLAVVAGPQAVTPVLASSALSSHLGATAETMLPIGTRQLVALRVWPLINVFRCCGAKVSETALRAERDWPEQLAAEKRRLREDELRVLGFVLLAAGRTDLIPKVVGGGKLPSRFNAGQTFQFNVTGFVRYAAAAIEKRAAPEDVAPAWDEFVTLFPRKLAAKSLSFDELLLAARAVMEHIERRPVGGVAAALHEKVSG